MSPRWRRWRTRRTRASIPGTCSTTRATSSPSSTAPGWTPPTKPPGCGGYSIGSALTSATGSTRARRTSRRTAAIWINSPRSAWPSRCRWPSGCSPSTATARPCSTRPRRSRTRSWCRSAKEQQFYTVLLADDAPINAPEGLAGTPARDPRHRRRRAVRAAGGLQRGGRHHRGCAQRRDPGRHHPARHPAAVPRPGAAHDHAARAE